MITDREVPINFTLGIADRKYHINEETTDNIIKKQQIGFLTVLLNNGNLNQRNKQKEH